MISTCAHTKTRSSASVVASSAKIPESASETGDQPAGQGFRPSAICVACQRSRVVAIPAMRARMRSASPRWEPSNRAGRCTFRIENADTTPTSTRTANTSTRSAYQPWCSSQPSGEPDGRDGSRSTMAAIAMKIVGKRTTNPQKMNACTSPGTRRWRSFRCPRTMVASFRTRTGRSDERLTGFPERTSRVRKSARRAKSPPAIATATTSATAEATLAVVLSCLAPSSARPRSPARPRAGRRSRRSPRSRGSALPGRC